jgi:hypothetical protein
VACCVPNVRGEDSDTVLDERVGVQVFGAVSPDEVVQAMGVINPVREKAGENRTHVQ